MQTDLFAQFLSLWFATGYHERTAGELMALAESVGMELPGKTLRARQITLGRWLTIQLGSPINHEGNLYTVRNGRFADGKRYYRIESNKIQSGENS